MEPATRSGDEAFGLIGFLLRADGFLFFAFPTTPSTTRRASMGEMRSGSLARTDVNRKTNATAVPSDQAGRLKETTVCGTLLFTN
jgi:hypothetical protein